MMLRPLVFCVVARRMRSIEVSRPSNAYPGYQTLTLFTAPSSIILLCCLTATTSLSATKESSRSEFFVQLGGLVGASTTLFPGVAHAAKYGGIGAGSPNVMDPKDADVDKDILASGAVQNAIKAVQSYQAAVKSMLEALEKNPQTDVGGYVRKEFDFVKVRSELNTINTAFDEDTQRGTDRIIRNILQDITEVEISNKQKDGVERSTRRLEILEGKLIKLDQAFSDFLAFASA